MAKRSAQFQTIRTEGAILPPDILRRIASLKVDGATPDAYHLPPGSKLNEAISRSWTSLLTHWQAFQEAREKIPGSDETGTAVTNDRWLLPLFKELDYGRLVTAKSPVIDERVYPIERFYNHTPIHLIGCKLPVDRRTKGARGAATASPHSMVQEFLNRSDEHVWAFLSNGLLLRILRDNVSLSRQAFVEFDLEAMMEGEVYADFALLWLLCHQSRVESDKPADCWLEKWSQLARDEGTRVLKYLRVGVAKAIEALGRGFIGHPRNDRLREKLRTGTLTKDDYYRQLLRVVYRLLFLFVAEDRELLHPLESQSQPPGASPRFPETTNYENRTQARGGSYQRACNLYDTHYSTRRLRELALKIRGSKHADLWHSLSLVFDALGKNEGCPQLALCGLGSFLWRPSSTPDVNGPLHEPIANSQVGNSDPSSPISLLATDYSLITNDDLLQAIRELAYVEQDRVLRIVDYRNLGSEELGSVYEALLELHPEMNIEAKSFELITAAGNERKITGSYYTPDSLVQCLLDSALDPVVEDRLQGKKGEDAAQAILDLKVCDPACGSGHFLIAAAHRLARHLARSRTGETEPSPEDYQHALRDIIGRCVYGVDLNPMAVELCKVSLWMEAIEPGKPLSFLDHHIQCGNSLLGTTPALLARGIPDEAFKPIEGDVKAVCSELKRENKRQRQDYESGQGYLFAPLFKLGNLPATIARINVAADESLQDVVAKQAMYERMVKGADYLNARLLADTWCAAFVWKKDKTELGQLCPTERNFRNIENNPHSILPHVKSEVRRLADHYQFFHWHLAFPDVFRLPEAEGKAENVQTGWSAGFDVVLGNPPWERIKTQDKEWFAQRNPEIANAANAAARRRKIATLRETDPELYEQFLADRRQSDGTSNMARSSGQYPLCGRGDVNTYPLFAELNRSIVSGTGRVGCIVPSGIATDDTTKLFFRDLMDRRQLVSLFDFWETRRIFPGTDSRNPFCLLTVAGHDSPVSEGAEFAFSARSVTEIADPDRRFQLSANDIALLNPNTRTCPVFRTRRDAQVTRVAYLNAPVLIREGCDGTDDLNPWGIKFLRMFDMASDSEIFRSRADLLGDAAILDGNVFKNGHDEWLPLYEAKMTNAYDHRYGSIIGSEDLAAMSGVPAKSVTETDHCDPSFSAFPRYWVPRPNVEQRLDGMNWSRNFLINFRDVARSTDSRTAIHALLPRVGVGHKAPLILPFNSSAILSTCLLANLNSFILDYCVRQSIGGASLSYFIVKQLPVFEGSRYEQSECWSGSPLVDWISRRVLELTYTAWDLEAFAVDCGYSGPPFRWDEARRFLLRCELDAAYFHLYLGSPSEWGADSPQLREMFPTPRDAVAYIMETFPIVRRKDIARTQIKNESGEFIQKGRYITKDTILEIYDEMRRAIDTGHPYQTRLDPPPGPPTDTQGNSISEAEWDTENWPAHIHAPRTREAVNG